MVKWLIEKRISQKILTLNNVLYRNIKNYSIFVNKKEHEIYQNNEYNENNEDDMLTKINIEDGKKLIVVHEKYKIQVSLCIDRFPINYVQEKFEEDFQNFKDEWLIKTNNNLDVNEEFFHMKYNLSNLNEKQKEKDNNNDDDDSNERDELDEQNEHKNDNTYNNNNTENKFDNIRDNNVNNMESINELSMEDENLEKLFSLEGIQDIFKKKEEKKKSHEKDKKNKKDENINEYDYKNIKRKPNDFLYLLVKYKHLNKWMFPIMDFKKNYSIRQNLQYLCMQQLKCNTLPFFIGYSPCTYEKRKFKTPLIENEIIGRKIFYYRAHYIKQHTTWNVSMNQDIQDIAWVTRAELKKFLSPNRYYVIKDALPLT
ncbi:mitochondrial ribosomal protein L46 precursor, putative [Plasmodium sp. gorilla clade G2]|uniref:mitochondrial ribosomal protein L46 precursor, putative n=1 Tax=Plasmodium sp. gorilla clade G2 TaxID=880535 RepID=UPI000D21FDD8|nr:mitochondrial ribosomal protein L46 precursor, putative [Plasmodium sp. gorilla clade G2]SOV12678.1 mitochondrial ribosomal protein L46 precursor, putative [Plasmodium sp. gorilla clade G2]